MIKGDVPKIYLFDWLKVTLPGFLLDHVEMFLSYFEDLEIDCY